MAWVKSAARTAVKYGAKYGPHAVVVWNVAGEHVQAVAKSKAAEIAERRKAFQEADAVVEGSVLKVVDHGTTRFVVFTGDQPISCYPETTQPPAELIAHANLSKRVTPRQWREHSAVARARRATQKVRGKGPQELG